MQRVQLSQPLFKRPTCSPCCRSLNGATSAKKVREETSKFMDNPAVPVFLLSKASGSVGLNLTVATHILLLESDWNSLTEDQAISRAHRLGCSGPITVLRYICKSALPCPPSLPAELHHYPTHCCLLARCTMVSIDACLAARSRAMSFK